MFKTGCLYSAPAFFFRCGSPRSNKIGASFESEVLSHVLFFLKKKVVSGYFSERSIIKSNNPKGRLLCLR